MTKVILVTGHRKSGTTLFLRLLDSHPDLVVYPADVSLFYAYLIPRLGRSDVDIPDDLEQIEAILRTSLFEAIGKTEGASALVQSFTHSFLGILTDGGEPLMFSNALTILEKAWRKATGYNNGGLFVVKETSQAAFRHMIDPAGHIKFVHLVRDPRDNYAALKDGIPKYYSKMGENEIETLNSLLFRVRFDLKLALDAQTQGRDLAVKFEDLVGGKAGELSLDSFLDFVGIPESQTMYSPTVLGQKFVGNSYSKMRFNGVSAVNIGRWRERISNDERMIIEFYLGDLMKGFGYALSSEVDPAGDALSEFYAVSNTKYFYSERFFPLQHK